MSKETERRYEVGPGASIEDVDLDEVEVRRKDGTRLTEAAAAELAAEVIRRGVGRPSLSGRAAKSPHLGLRVSPELNRRLRAKAEAEGKKPSEIVREALERYV